MALSFYRFPVKAELGAGCVRRVRSSARSTWSETETEYEYLLLVPGFEREAMEVEVLRNEVVVRANKAGRHGEDVSVEESFTVPERVDRDLISATVKDGVLKVTLPKRKKEEARVVEVEAGMERSEDGYEVEFEVPGAGREALKVYLEEGTLTVVAEGGENHFFRPFERSFTLPRDANPEKVRAFHLHGLLVVQVPKLQPVEIEVQEGELPKGDDVHSISVRLPGIKRENIKISYVGGRLKFWARREDNKCKQTIEEEIYIPARVDGEKAVASYRDGILTISAPKKELDSKKVVIQAA